MDRHRFPIGELRVGPGWLLTGANRAGRHGGQRSPQSVGSAAGLGMTAGTGHAAMIGTRVSHSGLLAPRKRSGPVPSTGSTVRGRPEPDLGETQAVEVLCHEWAHALAWNYSLDRLGRTPSIDPAEFDRASHDEAWGCAYSRGWRAYQEVIREAK